MDDDSKNCEEWEVSRRAFVKSALAAGLAGSALIMESATYRRSVYAAEQKSPLALKPVDKVVLTEVFGDNLFPKGKSDAVVKRLGDQRYTGKQDDPLQAHGMGILVEIYMDGKKRTILFDAGGHGTVLRNNFPYFGKNPSDIELIVISHGHDDHFDGLPTMLKMMKESGRDPKNLPIYVGSKDAFDARYYRLANGELRGPWTWPKKEVEDLGGVHVIGGPHLLLDGIALYTGPIPYITEYEKIDLTKTEGWCVREGAQATIRMIDMPEESALVLNIKNKGLLVISGCTHRGTLNTLFHAQHLTGGISVYARFGSYPGVDKDKAVRDLLAINPKMIFMGAHCSPDRPALMKALRDNLPHYYQSSVGSEFTFQ